uniref:Uncharacterized protein n=1 Tax=Aureoumbra lagunensis TaxID=44058 RepID=A0A7S3JWH7_9STRA
MSKIVNTSVLLLILGAIQCVFLVLGESWLHAGVTLLLCVIGLVLIQERRQSAATERQRQKYYLHRRRFELDAEYGFCCQATKLPAEYEPWERLARELAQLNRNGALMGYIKSEPFIRTISMIKKSFPDYQQRQNALHRAYIILSMVVQSLVHGDKANWELAEEGGVNRSVKSVEIPPSIAEPYLALCKELDLPPGSITAAATDLWNWGQFVCSMTGTQTEFAFHTIARKILLRATPELPALLDLPDQANAQNYSVVVATLNSLIKMLIDQREIFANEYSHIDPDIFYYLYRPLLAGTTAEDPMRLRLSDGSLLSVHAKGPSAGQSTLFLLLDACLLDNYSKQGAEDSLHHTFQREMLAYMPPAHRALVLDFCPRIQQAIQRCAHLSISVRNARLEARQRLADFRRFHLTIATRFLRTRGASTGTGGSDFVPMLKDAIQRSSTY